MKPTDKEEKKIIRAACAGDRDAFRQLVERYQARVLSVAVRILGNQEDARDAAQEVFFRLFNSLSTFNMEKKFFTWLYRITVNVCYDFLKREKRFAAVPLEESVRAPEHEANLENDFEEDILALLDRISTAQKTAFLLKENEDLSCRQIAQIMECPVGTVRSHLFYARKRLKEMIIREYPEYLEGILK